MKRLARVLFVALAACSARQPTRQVEPVSLHFGVDAHAHVTMRKALPFFVGLPGRGVVATSPDQQLVNQIEAPLYRRAGVRLLVAALWPPPARAGRTRMGEAVRQLDALREFARAEPDFAIASSAALARKLVARGRIALVPGLEGAEAIESADDVDVLFAAGARVIGLVHFVDTALADAEDAQFGPLAFLFDGKAGGLTPLGREAVTRMEQLGMLIDLSHASERTIADVLATTSAPVLYSHAGSAFRRPRTLPDELARQIGQRGGVIGIGVYRSALLHPLPEDARLPDHRLTTCDDIVAHWVHYARLAGAENVVLGSDLNAPITRSAPGGFCPDGVRHPGDLPYLFGGVVASGVPPEALNRAGDRFLRLMDEVESRADPAAREQALRTRVQRDDPFDVPM